MNLNHKSILRFIGLVSLGAVIAIAFYYYRPSMSDVINYLGIGSAIAGIGSLVYAFLQEKKNQKAKEEEKVYQLIQELEKKIDAAYKELVDRNLVQDRDISNVHRDASLIMQNYQNIHQQIISLTDKLHSFELGMSDVKASQTYQSRIAELIKRIDGLETVLLTQKTEELKSITELSRTYQSILSELKTVKGYKENILGDGLTRQVE